MRSFIYFFLLCSMLYFIPNKVDLRGHWHVYPQHNASLGGINYTIMEIADDGTGIFGASNYTGAFNGEINTRKRTMEFGGECAILNFNYNFKGEDLQLIQQSYGGKFLAIRCNTDCCNRQKDFFSYQNHVEIDLPIISDTTNLLINNFQQSLEYRLLYGQPKRSNHATCFGSPQVLVLDYKISSEMDIPIWYEKAKIKTNERSHPYLKMVFYADKDINMGKIKIALEQFKKIGLQRVYIALRTKSVKSDFKIWLKPFDLSNLETLNKSNDFRTVDEWLKTNSTTLN